MSNLKGIKTRQIPKVVVDYFIEIPRELIDNNQGFILFMEIMFINRQVLLTTMDKYIRFRGLIPLENIINEDFCRVLDLVMRYYNKEGFSVKFIECDREFK